MIEKEALSLIQKTAVKADGVRQFTVPAEPPHVYYTVGADGSIERREAEPHPTNGQSLDFDSLARIAVNVEESSPGRATLWYSRTGVLLRYGRDQHTLTLSPSVPMKLLCQWETSRGELSQVGFYMAMRTTFAGCLDAHDGLKEFVKKVDFKKITESSGTVNRANVSLSKSIIADVAGIDKLPEVLTFNVPVFSQAVAPVKAIIRVAFDLDPQSEQFRFVPIPGEIERAFATAEAWVAGSIATALVEAGGKEIPVYHGRP